MTSNLSEEFDAQQKKIHDLEIENAKLKSGIVGRSGTLIISPNPLYSEETCGIKFSKGRGFVPDDRKNAADIVKTLVQDFGYATEHIDDWKNMPAEQSEQVDKNMIDVLDKGVRL